MNYIILNFLKIIMLFCLSFSLRILLQLTGQNWIKTKAHTSTLVILPIITYVITVVISGNIALSLGMVGALSIVRFRNPVRSPLELTLYFAAITMGITASTSILLLFLLAFSIYFCVFFLFLISKISKKYFKKQFFITSFSEGNSMSSLEIEASSRIIEIEESRYLKSISFSKGGNKKYLLATTNFNTLKKLIIDIEDNSLIINYQLNE